MIHRPQNLLWNVLLCVDTCDVSPVHDMKLGQPDFLGLGK